MSRKSKGIGVVIDLEDDAKKKEKAWFQGWPVLVDKIGVAGKSGHHGHGGRPGQRGGSSPQLTTGWALSKSGPFAGKEAIKSEGDREIRIMQFGPGNYAVIEEGRPGVPLMKDTWADAARAGDALLAGKEPVPPKRPPSKFGEWTEKGAAQRVAEMQKKYPKFYERAQEHQDTNLDEPGPPGSERYLEPGEIPKEITELAQWDLQNRLGGASHVQLYSGVYVGGKWGPPKKQPEATALQKQFEQRGFPSQMSFTTNPGTAERFTEGAGSVVVGQVPISSVKVSPFVVPAFGDRDLGEYEFLVSPPKTMTFRTVKSPAFRQSALQEYRQNKWGADRLVASDGTKPAGKVIEGTDVHNL